jgi:YVTN family beta-propeller protein
MSRLSTGRLRSEIDRAPAEMRQSTRTNRHRAALLGPALIGFLLAGWLVACTRGPNALPTSPATASRPTTVAPPTTAPATSTSTATATATATTGPAGPGVYAQAEAGMLAPNARRARPLVYVPNTLDNTVSVIDQRTFKVIRTFRVGALPQHVVPSWDLSTLWVNDDNGNSLVPINPRTGSPGKAVPVADPYNLYFSPDGSQAMVMAERLRRIDFRDPKTMRLEHSLHVPCRGINHTDFTADLKSFVASCEFSGKLLVIPADGSRIARVVDLNRIATRGATNAMTAMRGGGPAAGLQPGATSMPQDVRLSPDGHTFLIADMLRNGVWLLDARTFKVRGFLHTGRGAHGLYPSRDGQSVYVSNRDEGTVSVIDATTLKVRALWRIPGGGSPDMGGVSADGSLLWLSGRSNGVVYVFDTDTGRVVHRISVGRGPHGLCVWPQPGRFSLGHTGNMR